MKTLRLTLLLSTAGLALAACGAPRHASDDAEARAARVVQVETRALQGGVSAAGLLVSREEAAVNTELSGYRVAAVDVEPGAYVRAGQPLAELDDTLLRSQIAQQTALVAQQQVAAEQADSQAKAVSGLDNQGVLSKEQLDQRRFAARSAQAALIAQTAQLHDLQTRDGRMVVRAPADGLILERNVRPGDIAVGGAGSTPMFRMARDGLIELEADVPEADLSAIHTGDAVQVVLSDGAKLTGSVRLVWPNVDSTTKLGKVRVRLPARSGALAGGFGRATFMGAARSAPAVPEAAIRYSGDGASVMVVGADDHVSVVNVRTGLHAGGYVELQQGPPVGARVLLGAAAFVLPGDRVKPIDVTSGGR